MKQVNSSGLTSIYGHFGRVTRQAFDRLIGEILTEHFPVKPGDINELSDEVLVGS